jgi:zinc D-Ala-D-Ala carboxypeptidase
MTPHFTMRELTRSATGDRRGIDNTPPDEHQEKLLLTAELLERVREVLGCPVIVTSAYRCMRLNLAVGGVTSSDHARGQAADIVAPGFGTPYEIAKHLAPLVSVLGIGQLLLEHVGGRSWVHVSTRVPVKTVNRVLTYDGKNYALGIQFIG